MNTFREIALKAGVPESTLRIYRDEFEGFLPTRGEGRRRRYDNASAELLVQIAQWIQQGWSKETVRRELLQRQAAAPRRSAPHTPHVTETVRLLQEQAQTLARIETALDDLRSRRHLETFTFEEAIEAV